MGFTRATKVLQETRQMTGGTRDRLKAPGEKQAQVLKEIKIGKSTDTCSEKTCHQKSRKRFQTSTWADSCTFAPGSQCKMIVAVVVFANTQI